MKGKAIAFIFALLIAMTMAGCGQQDAKPSPQTPRSDFAQIVIFDKMPDNDGSWRYNKPTEEQYAHTSETVALYLTIRGVRTDTGAVSEKLRKNERVDGVGVYLACSKLCNGKKGVIFGKKNSYRSLPTPVLVRVDGVWRIMAYHDDLRVLCCDSHGAASISMAPTKFDIGYMDSNMESVFVTDLGYSPGDPDVDLDGD